MVLSSSSLFLAISNLILLHNMDIKGTYFLRGYGNKISNYIYIACLKPKTWDKSREQKYLLITIHD
jgi:hypothetical protein